MPKARFLTVRCYIRGATRTTPKLAALNNNPLNPVFEPTFKVSIGLSK